MNNRKLVVADLRRIASTRRLAIGALACAGCMTVSARQNLPVGMQAYVSVQQNSPVAMQAYEWNNVQIVGGGFVTGIVFHPNAPGVAYARTDMGGGYRLEPKTGRWIPLTDFFTDYVESGIESVAVDPGNPDRVYFAQGTALADWAPKGMLLRSDDRGDSWERIPLPFKLGANEEGRSIGERLAVDPNDGDILFFGTRLNGLWKSIDRGATWNEVQSFPVKQIPGRTGIGIVLFDGRIASPGSTTKTIYAAIAAPNTPVYRSDDAGETWTALPGQPDALIPHHMELVTDGTLYVTYSNHVGPNGAGDGAVWKLDTATGQWTNITPVKPGVNGEPRFGYAGLGVDASDPNVVVVSTLCRWSGGDQLWRSIDAGATWRELSKSSERDGSAAPYAAHGVGHWIGDYAIDPFAPGHQLYVTGAGIWGTKNGDAIDQGQTIKWFIAAEGLEQCAILDLIYPPGEALLSGMLDLGGFRHDDINRSPRSGTFSNPGSKQVSRLDFAEMDPKHVVRINAKAWDGKGTFGAISSDGGATWAPFASVPPGTNGSGNGIAIAADAASIVWIPDGASAHHSTDAAATWALCQGLPESARWVTADRVDADTFYAVDGKSAKIHRSEDAGASFRQVGSLAGDGRLRATPRHAGDLWLPVRDKGLFRSTDGGSTFTPVPSISSGEALGFGKPAPGSEYPAVYLTGKVNDVYGVFRSDDAGANWVRLNDEQHHWGWLGFAVTGDPTVFGRVYLGTNGRGIISGDIRGPAAK
jgi:photosystem II stability/assembly factor-like uncharacterized protein